MTSFGPTAGGQRGWITPVLVAIAILAFVATAASFAWSMREELSAPAGDSEYVKPDPEVLNDFVAPEGFEPVRDVSACTTYRTSRCYLTDMSESRVLAVAGRWMQSTEDAEQKSYMGHPAYSWCSDTLGAPAYFSLRPNVINAKKLGRGSWQLPDEPKFDEQWILVIGLAESSTCE